MLYKLAKVKMDLIDNDTLVFVGEYPRGDCMGEQLHAFVNGCEKELRVEIIDQKYWAYIKLPADCEDVKSVRLCSYGEDETSSKKNTVLILNAKQIERLREALDYCIDSVEQQNGELFIRGWAIAANQVDISLDAEGEEINGLIDRVSRDDVRGFYPEAREGELCGFEIRVPGISVKNIKLVLATERITKQIPIIVAGQLCNSYCGDDEDILQKVKRHLRKLELNHLMGRLGKKTSDALMREQNEVTLEMMQRQRGVKFSYMPKISVAILIEDLVQRYLEELIQSVMNQTYDDWELVLCLERQQDLKIIKKMLRGAKRFSGRITVNAVETKPYNACMEDMLREVTGECVLLGSQEDFLSPDAFYELVKCMNENPVADVVYFDEDVFDEEAQHFTNPHYKSDFNVDLLCSLNYIGRAMVFKRKLLREFNLPAYGDDTSWRYALTVELCDVAQCVEHIAKVLYHSRTSEKYLTSQNAAVEDMKEIIGRHYERMEIPAKASFDADNGLFYGEYHWEDAPLVSIIIPNKDHASDLEKCINSIVDKSTYRNFEIVVVENNSEDEATFAFYKKLDELQNVKVVYYQGEFNYSAINNFGVKHSEGEYILLLNNDTELIAANSIDTMLGICMRKDVGVVGAKLLYPDDTVQHGGVIVGLGGIAGHSFVGFPRHGRGYFSRACAVQDLSAVTAACMMTKRNAFDAVGGLDETLAVAFNDIDYCMKVRNQTGMLVVYNPYALLYHYESKSRGLDDDPVKEERFHGEINRFQEKWGQQLKAGDPYYNPNLSLRFSDYSLK